MTQTITDTPATTSETSGETTGRFRLDRETWRKFGDVVGDGARSADLKEYIEWRLDHPDAPLPGRHRGPRRRQRAA
jgi:hypothetical protein